jgi:hypothetical protein
VREPYPAVARPDVLVTRVVGLCRLNQVDL